MQMNTIKLVQPKLSPSVSPPIHMQQVIQGNVGSQLLSTSSPVHSKNLSQNNDKIGFE